MKTKAFFMVCLLLGMGVAQLSAQENPYPKNEKGTGAASDDFVFEFWIPDMPGVPTLTGTWNWHAVFFYKNGALISLNIHLSDIDIYNPETGEVFIVNGHVKEVEATSMTYLQANFIGNKGTHFIINYSCDWKDWENENYIYYINRVQFPGDK
jgi:hypothetical protein